MFFQVFFLAMRRAEFACPAHRRRHSNTLAQGLRNWPATPRGALAELPERLAWRTHCCEVLSRVVEDRDRKYREEVEAYDRAQLSSRRRIEKRMCRLWNFRSGSGRSAT